MVPANSLTSEYYGANAHGRACLRIWGLSTCTPPGTGGVNPRAPHKRSHQIATACKLSDLGVGRLRGLQQ
eukprot:8290102-Alexandrium_andersonii.AAC.1